MNIIKAIFLSILSFFNLSTPKTPTNSIQDISPVSHYTSTITPGSTNNQTNVIPKYHLIKTTFIPQAPEKNWDQPWQDACEEAALLTLDYYYRGTKPDSSTILTDYQKIFEFEISQGWGHDVNLSQMATISATMFHLKPIILTNPSVQDLKDYLLSNIPIIVPANGKVLFSENSHFKSGGPWYHNLVILGFDDNKKQFIVHDVGTQFGAYFHYSYQTLLDSIHDFPQSGIKEDINNGANNVLILLK